MSFHADADARVEFGPALPHDDVSGDDLLAAVTLNAEVLSVGITAVAGGTRSLFGGEQLKVETERNGRIVAVCLGIGNGLCQKEIPIR